jgi:hypothetical protein
LCKDGGCWIRHCLSRSDDERFRCLWVIWILDFLEMSPLLHPFLSHAFSDGLGGWRRSAKILQAHTKFGSLPKAVFEFSRKHCCSSLQHHVRQSPESDGSAHRKSPSLSPWTKANMQNLIFKLLQQHVTVQIWLYEQTDYRIEGKIRVCTLFPTFLWYN